MSEESSKQNGILSVEERLELFRNHKGEHQASPLALDKTKEFIDYFYSHNIYNEQRPGLYILYEGGVLVEYGLDDSIHIYNNGDVFVSIFSKEGDEYLGGKLGNVNAQEVSSYILSLRK